MKWVTIVHRIDDVTIMIRAKLTSITNKGNVQKEKKNSAGKGTKCFLYECLNKETSD